jgi:acylpyruvate hydrolase
MRICTFSTEAGSSPRLGLVIDENKIVDVLAAWNALPATDRPKWQAPVAPEAALSGTLRFLEAGAEAVRVAGALAVAATAGRLPTLPLSAVRLHAPIPRPGKIIAVGRNYGGHLKESQEMWKARGTKVEQSAFPTGFFKMSSGVVGPEDPVIKPSATQKLDYEVELAVVIGRTAKNVSEADAMNYVAGYTVANDISARDWQTAEQEQRLGPTLGKNFDTFCPMGPWIVLTDEIPDPAQLHVELRVNGSLRQSAPTSDLIFNVPELVAHWSKMRLEPGDVVLTGTPSGVALSHQTPDFYLQAGDLVESTVKGIGTLRNRIVADEI